MFESNTHDLKDTITKLREPKPRIKIEFPNERKDSPISGFSIEKFERQYIVEMHVKEQTDLAKLGKIKWCKMKQFPEVVCLGQRFQIGRKIEKDNLHDLKKIFEVGEVLDTIDPKFITFIDTIIKNEMEYRKDESKPDRFNDLVVEETEQTAATKKSSHSPSDSDSSAESESKQHYCSPSPRR